jgi:hypothetical protein
MKRALTAICCCALTACATTNKGDVDLLKPTLDTFHGRMRWKDLLQIPQQLVPEKREAFIKACNARDDDKNLFVTDYQLEGCDVKPDDLTVAVCMSKVSWYRLPSATEKTVLVATTLKWAGGQWLIDRQSDGPFAEELSISTPAPAAAKAQKSTP